MARAAKPELIEVRAQRIYQFDSLIHELLSGAKQGKTVCPLLPVRWLALHCASEGLLLYSACCRQVLFELSASPASEVFRRSCFSAGSALGRRLDGIRRMRRNNLGRVLIVVMRPVLQPSRTHLIHRPAKDALFTG